MIFKKGSYRPLPEGLTIKPSAIDGIGLHSEVELGAAVLLGLTHIYYKRNWVRTPLGGFINHSDNPNCVIVKFITGDEKHLHTIKPIKKGEELTVYYDTTMPGYEEESDK